MAPDLPGSVAAELLGSAREAFTSGLNTVATVGAVLFAAIAVVALVALRRKAAPAPVTEEVGSPA